MQIPKIGSQPGDVMEADIPGHYHRIISVKAGNHDSILTAFECYPEFKIDGDTLVPISKSEAEDAFINLRRKYQ